MRSIELIIKRLMESIVEGKASAPELPPAREDDGRSGPGGRDRDRRGGGDRDRRGGGGQARGPAISRSAVRSTPAAATAEPAPAPAGVATAEAEGPATATAPADAPPETIAPEPESTVAEAAPPADDPAQ